MRERRCSMSTENIENNPVENVVSGESEPIAEQISSESKVPELETVEPPKTNYRWCYQDQRAFDEKNRKKSKKRGIILYASVMSLAFLICFGILLGTIVWYGESDFDQYLETALTPTEVFDIVAPSTVFIQTYQNSKLLGEGSGFFVREDGYIATNYHVIEKATNIKVYLRTGKVYVATVIGSDRLNDVAVLKIDGSDFPVAAIGNSDELRIGEPAIAIGNPAGSSGTWSVTSGIISALNRGISTDIGNSHARRLTVIQFDAAVNPGNSGGPLCNNRGEIVGIVTFKLKDHDGTFYEGMSYAIPINHAMSLIDSMI